MSTLTWVLERLESGLFHEFVGQREGEWFDAKQRYEFDPSDPVQRLELAKDVSAFANHEGGVIVFGLKTHPVEDQKIQPDLIVASAKS